jgi:hypothetical protein
MADRKTSALSSLAASALDKTNDLLAVVDVSEAADADKNKKITPLAARLGAFCGAMVKKSGNQTGANYSAGVAITWDAETYDTDAWHDNSSNNTRLTVPAGLGITKVVVACHIKVPNFGNNSTALLELTKNGSASFDGYVATAPWPAATTNTSPNFFFVSGPIDCTAGDYFEAKFTTNDTSVDITAAVSSFSIMAVG